jgi:hypothetical protein
MTRISSFTILISFLATLIVALPVPNGPTVGGPCGENHGDSSMCKDPKFPYCVPNYYMVSMMAGVPGKTIFVCESTSKGQI